MGTHVPLRFLKNPALNVLWKGYKGPEEKKDFVHIICCDGSFGWTKFSEALRRSSATSPTTSVFNDHQQREHTAQLLRTQMPLQSGSSQQQDTCFARSLTELLLAAGLLLRV